MIDKRLLRESPEVIVKDLQKRGRTDAKEAVDKLVSLDKKIRDEGVRLQELRHQRNENADVVARLKASGARGEEIDKRLKLGAEIGEKIPELEREIDDLRMQFNQLFFSIPNITHESVPFGKSDEDNLEIRRWGEPKEFNFTPRGTASRPARRRGLDGGRSTYALRRLFFVLQDGGGGAWERYQGYL